MPIYTVVNGHVWLVCNAHMRMHTNLCTATESYALLLLPLCLLARSQYACCNYNEGLSRTYTVVS
jgi:hypothetical protein